jgi:hypothetical protein
MSNAAIHQPLRCILTIAYAASSGIRLTPKYLHRIDPLAAIAASASDPGRFSSIPRTHR